LVLLAITGASAYICPFGTALPEDTYHPCNINACQSDPYGNYCSQYVYRFCLEQSLGESDLTCRTYSEKCPALLDASSAPRLPVGNYSRNATSPAIAAWPCYGNQCKDVFSPECTAKLVRFCGSTTSTFAGCSIIADLCPFPNPTDGEEWVCLNSHCTFDMRGSDCLDVMAYRCAALAKQDRPIICDALLTDPAERDGETDVLEWILELANPSAENLLNVQNLAHRGGSGSRRNASRIASWRRPHSSEYWHTGGPSSGSSSHPANTDGSSSGSSTLEANTDDPSSDTSSQAVQDDGSSSDQYWNDDVEFDGSNGSNGITDSSSGRVKQLPPLYPSSA